MAELSMQKLEHIEQLLVGIDTKIDNFLGFEELEESELKELREIKNEMQKGDYATSDEVFGDKKDFPEVPKNYRNFELKK